MDIKKQWKGYKIIADLEEVAKLLTPDETGFNLEQCYDECGVKDPDYLEHELSAELAKGVQRKGSCVVVSGSFYGVCVVKTRIAAENSGRGKRTGWRVYSLVVPSAQTAIVIGVTLHSNNDDNISDAEREILKRLIKQVEEEFD
ncbi:MAG: hypothetical protein J6328_00455 [Bacilli bacterium]|nr:hypothetical protein [Bacilli bacterium]